MSHFTRVRTKIVDGDVLEEALTAMGVSFVRGRSLTINGYMGNTTEAEFKVRTANSGYDIGFADAGGSYDVVADWWGIRDQTETQFVAEVTRQYSVAATKRSFAEQGFSLVAEENTDQGEIRLVLRRMA